MSSFVFQTGATSKTINVRAYIDTTFLPKTALVFNSAGMTAYFREGATGAATAITLATQTVGGAYSSGGFVLIDDTNMPGVYRLDLPNAALDAAAGSLVTVHLKATNVVFEPVDIVLTADDPTAAAATTAGIADAVLDEALSGHATAGTLGKAVADIETDATAVKAKTDSLTFSAAGFVDANIMEVNDNGGLTGDGVTPVEKA